MVGAAAVLAVKALPKAEGVTLPSVPAANVSLERHLAEEIFAGLDPEDKKAPTSKGPGITPGGGPNGLNKTLADHQAAYEKSKASRPNPLRPAASSST